MEIEKYIKSLNDILPKKPEPIPDAILPAMWRTMANSFTNDFKLDQLTKDFLSYFKESREKGIFIIGSKGIGKSMGFMIYERIKVTMGRGNEIGVFEVKEIEHQFKLKGQEFIDYLVKLPELVINDLGTDNVSIKHYGTNTELINEILILRYAKWQKFPYNTITHVTTNLTPEQIKNSYGDRIYDRIKEMFYLKVYENLTSYRDA